MTEDASDELVVFDRYACDIGEDWQREPLDRELAARLLALG